MQAWVDESIQVRAGSYILAAVVESDDGESLDRVRAAMRALVHRPRRRLHWRDESATDRRRIIAAVAALDVRAEVVVATGMDPKRQERARRKCLERLLHRLSLRHVEIVWIESRGPAGDQRDLAAVVALRTRGVIPDWLRVAHAQPLDEPMLWVPDAVAGVVGAIRRGEPGQWAAIEALVTLHELSL